LYLTFPTAAIPQTRRNDATPLRQEDPNTGGDHPMYSETEARKRILAAGLRLLRTGLVARTWGNVSARISDTHFLITPSGMAYETLREEDLEEDLEEDFAGFGSSMISLSSRRLVQSTMRRSLQKSWMFR